uniref:DUF3715 domain-containing protein n=1 Tax=Pygocentrus nattereri TaxID=42514 RepID=A0A3B4EP80_PYGNA
KAMTKTPFVGLNSAMFNTKKLNLSSDSREFGEILKIITSSYKDPSSVGNFVYSKPRLVHNDLLEKEFIEKRKELKQDGRTDKELAESFCFLLCDIPLICEKGLSVGSGWMTILGNASKGIYLCQFSDLLQVSPQEPGSTGEIIVFKVMKGKVKSIHDNMARTLDPTPKFDSHFSKNANRVTSLQSYRAFEYTQQYFYEYVDFELASRPRHVCPYAVISFQFKGKETTTVDNSGYIVWRGQFVNRGKEVYHSSLRSLSQPFLPFKLVEIGKVMKLDQVKLSISCSLFSWDLYSGSHEVFKKGLHCSLFEVVVEKNKSMENLTQLFQKLEEEGLVLVNLVNDNGFFFLLSSNQMSNSNGKLAFYTICCSLHNFKRFYLMTKIVKHLFLRLKSAELLGKNPVDNTPLLPVPQDPIMPHLDSFIPAFHYALGKVRCNPPANLGAGVEQQVHDYLSSIREGKLIQRVRLDYDHKLDEREKLFPAPRQKYNWENYVRSYFYNPHLFTMPVENAKKMVEELRCVPESSTDSETADGIEVHSDPERLKELLKLIQIKKNLAAKQKGNESDEGASDTHGLKRKSEDEANETSPKCMKMAPVNNRQPGEGAGMQYRLEKFSFSPCSDTNGQQRGVNLLGEKSIPWVLIPITGIVKRLFIQLYVLKLLDLYNFFSRTLYESEGEVSDGSVGSLTVEAQSRLVLGAGESMANSRLANESVAVEPAPAAISSLISQLQPEVISNLVKIIQGVQKNTVHFYIHSADEESDVCWEIKEYLKRLGNSECDPQTFLEKKDSQDKLLIIIQNIDIATHVHKIPALVSLKKLPSVSFAGVDSLDDIKNHTYNELFVSGGFIVSDEFVLNPDFIKQERLETLLQYLEELNTPESPWRWRVHCKTHKKVKEQSRCNSEALNILNLLTMYHKKQIVEFLSYHECDGQSRQAPDLNCLVKLQAQNIGQRHVIFLTERRFEMFPHYSSSGIVIANIDDILYNMASLIGEACDKLPSSNLHSCPTSPICKSAVYLPSICFCVH